MAWFVQSLMPGMAKMVKPANNQYSQQVSDTDKNLMASDRHFGNWGAKPVTMMEMLVWSLEHYMQNCL